MINLIIADDHVVLREALSEMLKKRGNFNVMAQASDGEQLLQLLSAHKPDVVIMDVSMPKVDGVEALNRMHEAGWNPPVLMLSANEGEKKVKEALKAGARGYLPKSTALEELEFAINSVLEGKTYLSPSITAPLMSGNGSPGGGQDPAEVLTKRELEILKLLADGKPNREIGKLLHISIRTVDTHRSNILKKLKVKTNAELVKIALTHGLITL